MNKERHEELINQSKEKFSRISHSEQKEIQIAYKKSMKGLLTAFAIDYTHEMSLEGKFESNADIHEFINDWVENHVQLKGS